MTLRPDRCEACERELAAGEPRFEGLCRSCFDHFDALWARRDFAAFLDGLPSPVLVVDDEGRVIAASRAFARTLGAERSRLEGLLGGDALGCSHALRPGGCGRDVHCRDCTIRGSVEAVARTGEARSWVPAFLETSRGRVDMCLTVRRSAGHVRILVHEVVHTPPGGEGGS